MPSSFSPPLSIFVLFFSFSLLFFPSFYVLPFPSVLLPLSCSFFYSSVSFFFTYFIYPSFCFSPSLSSFSLPIYFFFLPLPFPLSPYSPSFHFPPSSFLLPSLCLSSLYSSVFMCYPILFLIQNNYQKVLPPYHIIVIVINSNSYPHEIRSVCNIHNNISWSIIFSLL